MNRLRVTLGLALCLSLTSSGQTTNPVPEKSTDPIAIQLEQAVSTLKLQNALALFTQTYGSTIRLQSVRYATIDNELAPAYVFTPVKTEPGKKYPGLVFVRGSSNGQFNTGMFGLIEKAIARGYMVICPDIRGSSGYGLAYYKKMDVVGKQVDDVLSAADFLIDYLPNVDAGRLAVMGYSHGGLMVLLAIQKNPARFNAAVDVVGPANLSAYAARRTSPVARAELFSQPGLIGADKDPNILVEKSPIAHVGKIRTPLLILAATNDTTVPVKLHQEPLVAALKAANIAHEYELVPDPPGGHEFFHSDTRVAREAVARTLDFIDRHLSGGPAQK